jgi:hypothetical protein
MYVNGKMLSVESLPGREAEGEGWRGEIKKKRKAPKGLEHVISLLVTH